MVALDADDIALMHANAAHRGVESRWYGRGNAYGYQGDYGSRDVPGAAGELAIWLFYRLHYGVDLPWRLPIGASSEELRGPDVGDLYVRATDWLSGCLTIRPGEPSGRKVLAVADDGGINIRLPGYFDYAGQLTEGGEFWTNYGNDREYVWGIPQHALTKWP